MRHEAMTTGFCGRRSSRCAGWISAVFLVAAAVPAAAEAASPGEGARKAKSALDGLARGTQLHAAIGRAAGIAAGSAGDAGDGGGAGATICDACPIIDIGCGDEVDGALDAADCRLARGSFVETYRIEVTELTQLRIEMFSAPLDPLLFFTNSACELITLNDDCMPGNLDLSCITTTVDAGTYFIVATSFDANAAGEYTLDVACAPGVNTCEECVSGFIRCSETYRGELTAESCLHAVRSAFTEVLQLTVAARSRVVIELTSAANDSFLYLHAEDCTVVASHDDIDLGTVVDSILDLVVDPGVYFIAATTFDAGDVGPFELRVTCGPPFDLCVDCVQGDLECGGAHEGGLSAEDCGHPARMGAYTDLAAITLAEDTVVDINLTSASFDTFLFLHDESCAVVAFNDDRARGDLNSRLVGVLPAGTYYAAASSYVSRATGPYTLTLACEAPVVPCDDCEVLPLACDKPAEGELAAGDCQDTDDKFIDVYRFELARESEVTIELFSTPLDPYVILFDEACGVVAFNDDCMPGNYDLSCLSGTLPAGTYFAGATSYAPGEVGVYTLTLTTAACGGGFVRGDSNGDGRMDIADPSFDFNFLFLGGPAPPCQDAADANDEGALSITSGIYKLNFSFLGGPPPAAPFPECGPDPTEDALGCESYPPCE
jgi:hypothetical protein